MVWNTEKNINDKINNKIYDINHTIKEKIIYL